MHQQREQHLQLQFREQFHDGDVRMIVVLMIVVLMMMMANACSSCSC